MIINLNGNIYELTPDTSVTRSPMIEWPLNIRLDGQQKRKDRSNLSAWALDNWSNGLCLESMNVDKTSHQYRLWDAENVDTRWESFICLSPAFNVCTITPAASDLEFPCQIVDNLYFGRSGGTGCSLYRFIAPDIVGTPRNLSSVGAATSNLRNLRALGFIGGQISCVAYGSYNDGENAYWFAMPTLGVARGSVSQIALLKGAYGLNTTVRPEIGEIGGTAHCLAITTHNKALFFIADHTFANGSPGVASISTNIGSYLAPLESDGLKLYAALPEGIYNFDSTPGIAVDTKRSADRNLTQTLFENKLLFKNKKSLIEYDGTDVINRGYDKEDGLPSDKLGDITALASTWKFTFASVKGGTYSHILTKDRLHDWQYYARIPSAGRWVRRMFLSDQPDAIDRLWCVLDNKAIGYFLNPMVNPLTAATYAFVPTGYFTAPIFDGGMTEEPGAFFRRLVNADAVGESNKVTCYYGLNGDNPTVTLGIVSTINQGLIYGSPYGVEGYRIQPKFMLTGSPAGSTPVFRSSIEHYLKSPDTRESFDFTIDLGLTARAHTRPLEAIIGSLNYERDRKILMPFWYGQIPTKDVRVMAMPGLENSGREGIFGAARSGEIAVKIAEII